MDENWVVFPSEVEGAFSVFSVNTAFAKVAPLESHPFCHWVIIKYAEEGFPGIGIDENLDVFEDALVGFLEDLKGAYVGRFTSTNGSRQIFFYHPTSILKDLSDFVHAQKMPFGVSMNRKEDPDWTLYFGLLYPSPRDWQRIHIQHVLKNLSKHGDQHSIPRNIDHYAYFETENSACAFEEYLEKGDYSAIDRQEKEGVWNVSFKQFTAVEIPILEPTIFILFDKAKEVGGTYDGWGSPVTKSSEN